MSSAVISDNQIFSDDEARNRLNDTVSSLSVIRVFAPSGDDLPSEIRELIETAPLDVPFESYSEDTQKSILRGLRQTRTISLGSFAEYVE